MGGGGGEQAKNKEVKYERQKGGNAVERMTAEVGLKMGPEECGLAKRSYRDHFRC